MYLTEREILNQYDALKKTFDYIIRRKEEFVQFKESFNFKNILFTGSGSSFSLCQSAQLSANINLNIAAYAVPAGDLMLNFPYYHNITENSLIITPSRSGSTSELIKAVKKAHDGHKTGLITITAKENTALSELADISIELPWAFDESVCQTSTVSNLYTAQLLLLALISDNDLLIREIEEAIKNGKDFINKNEEELRKIGSQYSFKRAVVLADAELKGIGNEGALAFKEISQLHSNHYHLLDVRHGPMVMIDDRTLVIIATTPFGEEHQINLVKDLREKNALVITVGSQENIFASNHHIKTKKFENYSVMGIPFILIPQLISLAKALALGVNPDLPTGLDPWIEL